MTQAFSIRRATLQDVEALVSLRLKLQQESGHLTEVQALADLRQATHQYLLEALPTEAFLVWVAEASGHIVATSGLIFFQKPPSESNLSGMEAYILNMYTLPQWRGQGIATTLLHTSRTDTLFPYTTLFRSYATHDGKPLYEKAGFVVKTRHTLEMELFW